MHCASFEYRICFVSFSLCDTQMQNIHWKWYTLSAPQTSSYTYRCRIDRSVMSNCAFGYSDWIVCVICACKLYSVRWIFLFSNSRYMFCTKLTTKQNELTIQRTNHMELECAIALCSALNFSHGLKRKMCNGNSVKEKLGNGKRNRGKTK